MNNRILSVLSISALAAALAVPVLAQGEPPTVLAANIPFEFSVSGKTMPAGNYTVYLGNGQLRLDNVADRASVLSVAYSTSTGPRDNPSANTKLIFHRYGDKYFLAEAVDAYMRLGRQLPESRDERELAKTASKSTPEITTVLASLR